MTNWESIVELVVVILALIATAGGVPAIIDRLKTALNLTGTWALVLSWVVTGVVAVLGGIASGAIVPEIFGDPIAAIAVILSLFVGVEKMYQTRKANG